MEGKNGAVGRLTDILITYDQVDMLFERYNYLYNSIKNVKTKYEEQTDRVSFRNLARYYVICVLVSFALCVIYAIGGLESIAAYLILLFVVPAVFVGAVALIYRLRLLPKCKKIYNEYRAQADKEYVSIREKLKIQETNIELLTGTISDECKSALAIYIMRQAALDDKCCHVWQCQTYFLKRLRLLEGKVDETGVWTKITESRMATQKMMESLKDLNQQAREIGIA